MEELRPEMNVNFFFKMHPLLPDYVEVWNESYLMKQILAVADTMIQET